MSFRDIEKVLLFRNDISPFLSHLTKNFGKNSAKTNLESIIVTKELSYGINKVSDARFGFPMNEITTDIARRFFSAVCFTETPLNEIHSLLDISNSQVNLQPYGLVFIKNKLMKRQVSPVIYINNSDKKKIKLMEELCNMIKTNPDQAANILPYISIFGNKLLPVAGTGGSRGSIDFKWEREWRYASKNSSFSFDYSDVFMGMCDHEHIDYFEYLTNHDILFFDPRRNIKWYAEKLVKARKNKKIVHSVV